MGISAQELRIGNLVEYKITDSLDERKEWWELNPIDVFDLQHLVEFPDDEFFRPIPLTEEWLLKFGFKSNPYNDTYYLENIYFEGCKLVFECNKTRGFTELWSDKFPLVENVHQLQNLYFALTSNELTQVSEGENKNNSCLSLLGNPQKYLDKG